jgi:hypothetical protein
VATRRQLPVSRLVEDLSLYPRHALDDAHIASLVRSLQVGVELPPVVADAKSMRIIDGWHRCRAYRRQVGDDAVVDVELVSYPDEDSMLIDAMRRNADHGRKLDRIDQVRCLVLAEERGIKVQLVAQVLHVPSDFAQKIKLHVAYADGPMNGTVTGTSKVALKRPLRHLDGTHLSDSQVQAALSAPGTSYMLLANQLISGLKEQLINLEDQHLVERLRVLRDEIGRALRK